MQCKDTPDMPILQLLARNPETWHPWGEPYSMISVRDAMPPGRQRRRWSMWTTGSRAACSTASTGRSARGEWSSIGRWTLYSGLGDR